MGCSRLGVEACFGLEWFWRDLGLVERLELRVFKGLGRLMAGQGLGAIPCVSLWG